jgi:DNA-nicking Smr family endonuclease
VVGPDEFVGLFDLAAPGKSIDLHGLTVPEALATLPVFLDRAIRADLRHVEIIDGIGGGGNCVRPFAATSPGRRP